MRLRIILILGVLCSSFVVATPTAAAEHEAPPCDPATTPDCAPPAGPPQLPPPPPHIQQLLFGPAPVLAGPSKTGISRIDVRYSEVAAELSRVSNAQARCWGYPDWSIIMEYTGPGVQAFVMADMLQRVSGDYSFQMHDKAHLAPWQCERLDLLTYARKQPTNHQFMTELAMAVNVLSHESMHIGGTDSEMIAQCWGVQLVERTAMMLGAKPGYADRLGKYAWRYVHSTLPLVYNSPLCRDGGLFDLNPMSRSWPS